MAWTVGRKIAAGFAAPVGVLLALSGVAYWSTERQAEAARWQSHTHEVLTVLGHIDTRLSDAQRGQRGYVICEKDAYFQTYREAVQALPREIDRVADLTHDNPRQQRRIADLRPAAEATVAELDRVIALMKTGGRAAAEEGVRTGQDKVLADRVRGMIDVMEQEEQDLLRVRAAEVDASVRQTHLLLLVGTVGAAVGVALVGSLIIRSVTRPVRQVMAELSATGAQLLASTTQQAAGAQEQAAAVSETVATVDAVTQTSDQAAHKARGIGDAVQRTAEIGRAGRRGADDAIAALAAVQERMAATAEGIVSLAEQAQAIGEIIATVNDIAEQTNVLALNAAIEASRAGDEGRGFAVVAGEVKALADQSKKATAQVRQILGQIQKATHAAVLATEEVSKGVTAAAGVAAQSGRTIAALTDTLAEAAHTTEHVVASAGQQAIGMSQIHQAMRDIDAVARQNVSAVQQTEQAAKGLNVLSGRLAVLVGR